MLSLDQIVMLLNERKIIVELPLESGIHILKVAYLSLKLSIHVAYDHDQKVVKLITALSRI
jgi:hypothetical protein